jgi:hypothetical protein
MQDSLLTIMRKKYVFHVYLRFFCFALLALLALLTWPLISHHLYPL